MRVFRAEVADFCRRIWCTSPTYQIMSCWSQILKKRDDSTHVSVYTVHIPNITMKRPPLAWIIIIIVLVLGIWFWSGYNGLVTAHESVDASWSQVETQYQRRFDLIPNLTNTVKGAANFEQETFTQVTAARSQWQSAGSREQQIVAAENFDSALGRLLVTVESYPQLQATQAFRDFMVQLEGTENRIATARRDYNEAVRSFNVRIKRFPTNLLAGTFGFSEEEFFEATQGSDQAPSVEF